MEVDLHLFDYLGPWMTGQPVPQVSKTANFLVKSVFRISQTITSNFVFKIIRTQLPILSGIAISYGSRIHFQDSIVDCRLDLIGEIAGH